MTDHAPLTDEELARATNQIRDAIWMVGQDDVGSELASRALDRLVNNLQASWAEIERIAETRYDTEFEAAELTAEVERLRERLDYEYRHPGMR